ncbi:MAG TPA: hypothetical protein VNK05_09090, partial [Chloroflexota bacterium]|nr:hypothetical protein [Chloroflexota bacterium]
MGVAAAGVAVRMAVGLGKWNTVGVRCTGGVLVAGALAGTGVPGGVAAGAAAPAGAAAGVPPPAGAAGVAAGVDAPLEDSAGAGML